VYDWGHVKTAINIRIPLRSGGILGICETRRFRTKFFDGSVIHKNHFDPNYSF
jgi:hypothetical protein